MEFNEMIMKVLFLMLTVVVPVVFKFVADLIKTKISESTVIKDKTENENLSNLVKDALLDVMDAVIYVNQVYTDALKAQGKFDEAAQDEAFNKAYIAAMNMISDKSKVAIEKLYGSFDKWLKLKIEASVNVAKKQ